MCLLVRGSCPHQHHIHLGDCVLATGMEARLKSLPPTISAMVAHCWLFRSGLFGPQDYRHSQHPVLRAKSQSREGQSQILVLYLSRHCRVHSQHIPVACNVQLREGVRTRCIHVGICYVLDLHQFFGPFGPFVLLLWGTHDSDEAVKIRPSSLTLPIRDGRRRGSNCAQSPGGSPVAGSMAWIAGMALLSTGFLAMP